MHITSLPSPNCDARPRPVDMLVLHYTGMQSAQAAIDRLRDPQARVSSHYVVDEDGQIVRLVSEEQRAWHAGISFWRGQAVLNDGSVGIEIVNPGHEWGYRPFPDRQIQAVIALSRAIRDRHAIPARNVVAHSDIAPDRKQDPGELFPWRELAEAGVGLFCDADGDDFTAATPDPAEFSALGYEIRAADPAWLGLVLTAFQRHWRPEAVTGSMDVGTQRRLSGLLRLIR